MWWMILVIWSKSTHAVAALKSGNRDAAP